MYRIAAMKPEDVPYALEIWHKQFLNYCGNNPLPDFWTGGQSIIETFLLQQIEKGNALVAMDGNHIVGYFAWLYIRFHKEETAFCPIVGNAALSTGEAAIYHALYTAASQTWVLHNKFNHLWMIFYDDICLKDMLYDIGFGSYVIDASQKISRKGLTSACPYKITLAVDHDADALLGFANETVQYYLDAPIFLKREVFTRDTIAEIIKAEQVLVAWDGDNPIGVMNFNVNQEYHYERLTSRDSAYIKHIGAYIHPAYRGKGVGTHLLKAVFEGCAEAGKSFIHVSYETANPFANRFWPKSFKPIIRSVRRSINKDANPT